MSWVDERAAMAYELGAARFLLEHYFAGTANEHVRRETQAWLDRARGVTLAWSGGTGRSDRPGRSDDCDRSDEPKPGQADQGSPFDGLGE